MLVDEEIKVVVTWMRRDTPICPDHGVMRAYKTRGRITYYACRSCLLRAKTTVKIISKPDQ